MPYIDLAGLSRFASRQKDQLEREYALLRDMQWLRTEKAGAVSLWPVGGTPLKPAVDFMFTETPPASGDKGPDNPSTITGVSSVNAGRIGKNQLLKLSSFNWAGLDVTANADGSYTFNGTITLSAFSARAFTDSAATYGGAKSSVHLDRTKNYTISCELVSGSVSLSNPDGNKPGFVYGCADTSADSTGIALPLAVGKNSVFSQAKVNDAGEFIARVQMFQTTTFTNAVYRFQLEEGSIATDFEAPILPADANNTVNLGSTYYGGSIDLATGVMTVNYASYTFGGNTGFSTSAGVSEYTNFYRLAIYPATARSMKDIHASCACNTLPVVSTNSNGISCIRLGNNSSKIEVDLRKDLLNLGDGADFNTVKTAFNSFFSSYPATVVYVVSTPQTVQLSPVQISALAQADKYTPRLNTVYSDQQAVQVGYVKSPIRDEYELQQAVIAQGGNV